MQPLIEVISHARHFFHKIARTGLPLLKHWSLKCGARLCNRAPKSVVYIGVVVFSAGKHLLDVRCLKINFSVFQQLSAFFGQCSETDGFCSLIFWQKLLHDRANLVLQNNDRCERRISEGVAQQGLRISEHRKIAPCVDIIAYRLWYLRCDLLMQHILIVISKIHFPFAKRF